MESMCYSIYHHYCGLKQTSWSVCEGDYLFVPYKCFKSYTCPSDVSNAVLFLMNCMILAKAI